MPGHNQPGFRVTLDGRDLTEAIAPRLISLSISEKRGGEADQLDLVIHDHDAAMDIPKKSARLHVSLGWLAVAPDSGLTAGLVDKGSFQVDEAEWSGPPDIITIRGRSADLTAGYRQRRERRHRSTTIGAIVRELAAANSLTPHVDARLAAISVPVVSQDQVSDMALIRRLGRRYDAVAQIRDGRLIFMPIGAGVTPGGSTIPAATLTRRDGDKYTFRRVERGQYNAVEARWHDQAGARRRTVTARADGSQSAGSSSSSSGSSSSNRDCGVRRIRRVFANEADARRAVQAEAGRIRRAAAEFEHNLAFGRPDLYPERPLSLSGFKPEIDAKAWLIAEVTHSLGGDGGLRTQLKLETRG